MIISKNQTETQKFKKNIIEHLRHNDAKSSKYATQPLETVQETNMIGQLTFNWTENGKIKAVVLSTGAAGKGEVKLSRYYDDELSEWIYKTERTINEKQICQYLRLYKKEKKSHWVFRTFPRNLNKKEVIRQLKSENARSKELFSPLEWVQETNARGIITFSWGKNGKQKNIGMNTGHLSRGMVKIKRYFDDSLGEWIYKTERVVDDKNIVKYSRLVKNTNKDYWAFHIYYPYREKIIKHLKSENAQSKDDFKPFETIRETSVSGNITFDWTSNGKKINVSLSTGSTGKSPVTIKRYFDEYLKEWIYETKKTLNDIEIIRQSRLVRTKKDSLKSYWTFKAFNINKEKVIIQLKSEDAQDREKFSPLEWTQKTDNDGLIWFSWIEKNIRIRVVLCIGVKKRQEIKLKRFFDEEMNEWIFETETIVNDLKVIRKSRLIPFEKKGIKYWKFKLCPKRNQFRKRFDKNTKIKIKSENPSLKPRTYLNELKDLLNSSGEE